MSPGRALRALAAALRRLNAVDVAHLHVKAAAGVWSCLLVAHTPRVLGDAMGSTLIVLLCGMLLIGAAVSSLGLVIAARNSTADLLQLQADLRRAVFGLLIEFLGLALIFIAVSLYFASQAALATGPEGDQRIALAGLAYLVGAQFLARITSVLHRRRKEIRTAKSKGITL